MNSEHSHEHGNGEAAHGHDHEKGGHAGHDHTVGALSMRQVHGIAAAVPGVLTLLNIGMLF